MAIISIWWYFPNPCKYNSSVDLKLKLNKPGWKIACFKRKTFHFYDFSHAAALLIRCEANQIKDADE